MYRYQTTRASGIYHDAGSRKVKEPANPIRKDGLGTAGAFVLDPLFEICVKDDPVVVCKGTDVDGGVGGDALLYRDSGWFSLDCHFH